jgi:anti-anti-sigma factor
MTCDVDSFEIGIESQTCVVRTPEDLTSIEWNWIEPLSEAVFAELASFESPRVVVDLEGVSAFSAAFLALLLRIWRHVESRGGQMILCGVNESAYKLLRITALESTWRRYPSRDLALQALRD